MRSPSHPLVKRFTAARGRRAYVIVQDINPAYLTDADYELAQDIYEKLEMRVPHSILNGLKGDDSHRSGREHK